MKAITTTITTITTTITTKITTRITIAYLFQSPDMNGSCQSEDDDSVEFLGVPVPEHDNDNIGLQGER